MPDAAKESQQGRSGLYRKRAVRNGTGEGRWSHANLYSAAGGPPQYTLEGVPRYRWELRDEFGGPTQLLADALLRGIQPVDNPEYLATIQEASLAARASMEAESITCGRDSVGLATYCDAKAPDGTITKQLVALGSHANCVPPGHPDRYPTISHAASRPVTPTGGLLEGVLPHGFRWATAKDQPGHPNAGYTVKLETEAPEPPAPRRERGKRSPEAVARRKARAAAKRRAKYDN